MPPLCIRILSCVKKIVSIFDIPAHPYIIILAVNFSTYFSIFCPKNRSRGGGGGTSLVLTFCLTQPLLGKGEGGLGRISLKIFLLPVSEELLIIL